MKFLCLPCDRAMEFAERHLPGDGTLAAVYQCPGCGREMALLTNPMETGLVSGLGIKIGGREVPEQPMELVRSSLKGGREDAFPDAGDEGEGAPAGPPAAATAGRSRPVWTPAATDRLGKVPSFVRGMVKRIYTDYARERGIAEITPEVMDRARTELGLEGM